MPLNTSVLTRSMALPTVGGTPPQNVWRGVDLGRFERRLHLPTGWRTEMHHVFGTGEVFGLRTGFASVDDAVMAAGFASRREASAVAVLAGVDGRFHLRGVRSIAVAHDQNGRKPWSTDERPRRVYLHHSYDPLIPRDVDKVELGAGVIGASSSLHALVDGDALLRPVAG